MIAMHVCLATKLLKCIYNVSNAVCVQHFHDSCLVQKIYQDEATFLKSVLSLSVLVDVRPRTNAVHISVYVKWGITIMLKKQ